MRDILAHLYSVGWTLHASTDLSKKIWIRIRSYFQKQQDPPIESQCKGIAHDIGDFWGTIILYSDPKISMIDTVSSRLVMSDSSFLHVGAIPG